MVQRPIILCFKNLLITFYEEVPLNSSSFFPQDHFWCDSISEEGCVNGINHRKALKCFFILVPKPASNIILLLLIVVTSLLSSARTTERNLNPKITPPAAAMFLWPCVGEEDNSPAVHK